MNPYRVLGISEESDDDDAIRKAWLDGVRRFPPEKDPEQFALVREAYEMIRDRESRFRLQTFGDRRLRITSAIVDLFPSGRNHAGSAPWLAVIRGGTR